MKKHFFENKAAEQSSDSVNIPEMSETEAEEKLPETLFTKSEDKKKKKRRAGMVKAQKIMIASFACVAVVLSVLYFAWLKPQKDKLQAGEPSEPPVLLEGEAHTSSKNGILVFPHIEIKNIKSIEVHNAYGTFNCLQTEAGKETFVIKEHPQAPISTQNFTSFAVDAGYTVVDRRVDEDCKDLSLYGLADEDEPAYYILTEASGKTHKVYIGNETPAGTGYYARYEGRNVVYVLSSNTIASTLLSPATALITPILGYPYDTNSVTMMDAVMIYKNGQPFVHINYTESPDDEYALSAYEMKYPGNYVVNDDNYAVIMLAALAQLSGSTVLEAGGAGNRLIENEAIMIEYGFFDSQNPPYELYYYTADVPPSIIMFAPSGVDGYYFAYSYLYDTIALIDTKKVEFLDWDLLDFIDSALFAEYIIDVSEISVSGSILYSPDASTPTRIYDINERFSIKFDEDNETLDCFAHSTQKLISGTTPDVNFVQGFYGTALRMKMEGYIKSEGVDVSKLDEYASMTVKKDNGETIEYKFYRYSNRCYYTVNGEGEFYLSLYDVNKLLIDAVRAAHGNYVDNDAEFPKLPESFLSSVK